MNSIEIVEKYYEAFNQQNWDAMLALVHPNIAHEPNQGESRLGKEAFTVFMADMDRCYSEELKDIVLYSSSYPEKIAASFMVHGIYKEGDEGFPEAKGQKYVLPAAAFLELRDGLISKVTTYYNLQQWIKLVS
ncbi:MAG: nuclear transport factor 2 family protein [Saprospiraceae bacterium]|nr:nuclear transport factor 2 family protein [Saprospiraceae bacterium]